MCLLKVTSTFFKIDNIEGTGYVVMYRLREGRRWESL